VEDVDQKMESFSGSVAVNVNELVLSSLISMENVPVMLIIGASLTGTTRTSTGWVDEFTSLSATTTSNS
jgi:hypothetical protein